MPTLSRMQTITFSGRSGEHLSIEIMRDGASIMLRTSDERATLPEDDAGAWIEARVYAVMDIVARVIIRETSPGIDVRALSRYGAPIEWSDTGKR